MNVILLGIPTERVDRDLLRKIRSLAPDYEVVVETDKDAVRRLLPRIEIVARSFPRDFLHEAPQLKWFQQWHAGADWLERYPAAVEAPFVLTGAQGVHAIPIAEHILALLLAFARQLPYAFRHQLRSEWSEVPNGRTFELAGKTMLLLGVGQIGTQAARAAQALGMKVIGMRSDPSKQVDGVEEMYGNENLNELLPRADFVVNTLPLTKSTRRLIGAKAFDAMKNSAIVINIGRGGTIDEEAMVEALQAGSIAGAGLDVFESEPLPEESPLWGMENVIITGHYSGNTPRYDERAFEIFLDNLERYVAGRDMRNVIDKQRGY